MAVDGVFARIAKRILDVFIREMKVATPVDMDALWRKGLNLRDSFAVQVGLKLEFAIRMRTGYDVGGACLCGQAQHFETVFDALRSVVDAVDDMTVDIDHGSLSVALLGPLWRGKNANPSKENIQANTIDGNTTPILLAVSLTHANHSPGIHR